MSTPFGTHRLKYRRVKDYLTLLPLLPFLLVALIPQGMMLSPAQTSITKTLVLCTSNGLRTITLTEAMGLPSDQQTTPQENSCPYSIANSTYIDTSGIIAIPEVTVLQARLLAHYRVQYLINLYPAGFPRGPPAIV